MILRPATVGDIETIAVIWQLAWRDGHLGHVPDALVEHRQLEDFRLRIPERLDRTTVAMIDARMVGFVTVHEDEIEQVFVSARARGTGVAAALLRHGEQLIAARFDHAWLAVVAGNARARRFYAREGWSDAGLFQYTVQIPSGTMIVPSHRYEKQLATE
jgi:GNAT superfamily N-acetyltransferase